MAGLGRKVFTAGDVLTASDVQNYLMDQTNMVFAGTAARSSAIATPTDGMITYNQSNDQLEAYNGSAWVGMSGLQLVKSQVIGSGVSTVSVTGAFSSTYENYFITISGVTASVGNGTLNFYFEDSGGTALTTGNYGSTLFSVMATGTTASAASTSNIGYMECGSMASTGKNYLGFFVYGPNTTDYKRVTYQSSDTSYTRVGGGYCNNATQFTRFRLLCASGGTMTGGTIRVYGIGIG